MKSKRYRPPRELLVNVKRNPGNLGHPVHPAPRETVSERET